MSASSNIQLPRQFRRHSTSFEARFEPHQDHADQFRLSLPNVQTIVVVTDVSQGGLGITSTVYIPPHLRLKLHLSGVCAQLGQPERVLSIAAIVRACKMIDHKPTFQVGLQFADANGEDEKMLVQATVDATARAAKPVEVGAMA